MRINSGCQLVNTYALINGVEQEVLVHYFVQPAEDDTNTPFGIELESVIFKDGGKPKVQAFCMADNCGSSAILFDAYATWDYDKQEYVLLNVFEKEPVCDDCGGRGNIDWQEVEDEGDVLGEMSEVEQDRLVASILESYEWSE